VACLSAGSLGGHHQHAGTAKVSPTPQLMTRSSHPNFMFGSTDKTFMNLLHHHESGLAGNHHKTGTADFSAAAVAATGGSGGCCGGGSWNRQRHSTVAAVLIVAYFTHHLPLLVSLSPLYLIRIQTAKAISYSLIFVFRIKIMNSLIDNTPRRVGRTLLFLYCCLPIPRPVLVLPTI
jgi:hypothetical protein